MCEYQPPCDDDAYFACVEGGDDSYCVSGGYADDPELSSEYESGSGSDEDYPMLLTPPSHTLDFDDDVDVVMSDECTKSHPVSCFDDDEEEEDDLPPFDDWYMDIAQRAGLSC